MANNANNVATGKAKISGAIYKAAITSSLTIPSDATTALTSDYVGLGFVSEDGLTNGRSSESQDFKDWNGNIIYSSLTSQDDTFKLTLVEVLNADVLKSIYGDSNVIVDSSTGDITIKVTASDIAACVWVFETVLNGKAKRIVIPNGKISEVGDVTYKADELMGYEITIKATPDATGYTHYEYIEG